MPKSDRVASTSAPARNDQSSADWELAAHDHSRRGLPGDRPSAVAHGPNHYAYQAALGRRSGPIHATETVSACVDLAIVARLGDNDEIRLAQFVMIAEKLRIELQAKFAKLALWLNTGGLKSKRIARSHPIDQKGKTIRGLPGTGAHDEATRGLGI